ncbi:MKI67 FHA domain-interacting nucleolar phosphoprotein-like isoform X1 [Oncorhynchus clarkii lewisi]|uniref:MKI67 FHA domain-interacting nucleolar phosphoprotein-like isoform X1 n=1 Tax=Oncorhynchus clarkii lewisi TaxID=490388 RepID=UPI0039B8862E
MNNLMGEILIKCNQVPTEVHEELFVGSQRAFKKLWLATTRHTPEEVKEMTGRLLHKEAKFRKRLAEKGIHYDFPGFASQVQQKKKLDGTVNASMCNEAQSENSLRFASCLG